MPMRGVIVGVGAGVFFILMAIYLLFLYVLWIVGSYVEPKNARNMRKNGACQKLILFFLLVLLTLFLLLKTFKHAYFYSFYSVKQVKVK